MKLPQTPMVEGVRDRTALETAFFVVGGICGIILFVLIGSYVVTLITMHSDQLVSDEITVSSDWVTITSKQPMEPVKQHQSLVLEVADPLLVDNRHPENIRFADGSVVHPEVQMVDESGHVYDVKMERALTPSRHLNSIEDFASLPAGRTFTQVRIRSDRPLRLSKVLWHCVNGK